VKLYVLMFAPLTQPSSVLGIYTTRAKAREALDSDVARRVWPCRGWIDPPLKIIECEPNYLPSDKLC